MDSKHHQNVEECLALYKGRVKVYEALKSLLYFLETNKIQLNCICTIFKDSRNNTLLDPWIREHEIEFKRLKQFKEITTKAVRRGKTRKTLMLWKCSPLEKNLNNFFLTLAQCKHEKLKTVMIQLRSMDEQMDKIIFCESCGKRMEK